MKFIYFTDPHGRANNPISRLDNFPETILKKIEWVVQKANDEDAYILCGGDWLNRPDTSPQFVAEMGRILNCAKHLPIYTVLGNHDVYGYNPNTFKRTPLHILEEVGIIEVLNENPVLMLGDNVCLSGASSTYDLDKSDKKGYTLPNSTKPSADSIWIHIVHGFLTKEKKNDDFIVHTSVDEILDTKADIVLSGHEHNGFGVVEKNNKLFCNPGALARVTAGIGDVNMTVSVALIDTSKDISERINIIPCPIAKPSDEVLDREKLVLEKKHEKKMQTFFSTVADVDLSMLDTDNVFEIFDKFCEQEDVSPKTKKLILEYLTAASERVNGKDSEDGSTES